MGRHYTRAVCGGMRLMACDGGAADEPCDFPRCQTYGCEPPSEKCTSRVGRREEKCQTCGTPNPNFIGKGA